MRQVNRWWQAPELLVRWGGQYDDKVDIWSVGCIMAELLRRTPLFPGTDSPDQLKKIIEVTGTPTEQELNELCIPRMFHPVLPHRCNRHEEFELGFSGMSVYPG